MISAGAAELLRGPCVAFPQTFLREWDAAVRIDIRIVHQPQLQRIHLNS
jgi:hypothetical protein